MLRSLHFLRLTLAVGASFLMFTSPVQAVDCVGSSSGNPGTCDTITDCTTTTETPTGNVCKSGQICCMKAAKVPKTPPVITCTGTCRVGACLNTETNGTGSCADGETCCTAKSGSSTNFSCYSPSLGKEGECSTPSVCNISGGTDGGTADCTIGGDICCVPKAISGGGGKSAGAACDSGTGTCKTSATCSGLTVPGNECDTNAGLVCCAGRTGGNGNGTAGSACDNGNGTCSTIATCGGLQIPGSTCNTGLVCCTGNGGTNPGIGGSTGGSVTCPANYEPIAGVCFPKNTGLSDKSVLDIVAALLGWLLAIFGFIALLGFIISGLQYLTAAGNEGQAETAKRNMQYSVIGIIVALSGWIVIKAVDALLNANSWI